MYPTAAAVASLNWPSRNHLSFEQPRPPQSSLGECPIYPLKSPTRFREDPVFSNYDLTSAGNVIMPGPSGFQSPFSPEAEYAPSNWQPVSDFGYRVPKENAAWEGKALPEQQSGFGLYSWWMADQWHQHSVRSGFPISISQSQDLINNAACVYAGQRPNATGASLVISGNLHERLNGCINPGAFSTAPQFTFGNLDCILEMRGLGLAQWDIMSVFKNIPILETGKSLVPHSDSKA